MGKRVMIFGGSGFVGQQLGTHLVACENQVTLVSRNPNKAQITSSFPARALGYEAKDELLAAFKETDLVINLAGDSLADGRWSPAKKRRVRDSRVGVTKMITELMSACENPPPLWLQASATGYYGASREEVCTEDSEPGDDFLADVCQAWENAVAVDPKKTRVVYMRLGVVLGTTGGALPEISDVYAAGLGARLGSGRQAFAWVHVEDVIRFVDFAIHNTNVEGVFNIVAPELVRNIEWHQALRSIFRCIMPLAVPAPVLQMVLGEKSELVLKGVSVQPQRAIELGFEFKYADLDAAVHDLFRSRDYPNLHFLHVYQWVPRAKAEVWDFFGTEKNLEKITPDFLKFKVLGMDTDTIKLNSHIEYKLRVHGIPMRWLTRITEWQPGEQFVDYQLKGPYGIWHHRHRFSELAGGTLIEDLVHFRLPVWPLGNVSLPFVRRDVAQIFRYRQEVLYEYLGA